MGLAYLQSKCSWVDKRELVFHRTMRSSTKIKPALQGRQQKQKLYYDRNAKPLEPLKQGDKVKMCDEDKKVWLPATVMRVNEEP